MGVNLSQAEYDEAIRVREELLKETDKKYGASREILPGLRVLKGPVEKRISDFTYEERSVLAELQNPQFAAPIHEAPATDSIILYAIYCYGGIANEKMIISVSSVFNRLYPDMGTIKITAGDTGRNVHNRLLYLASKGFLYRMTLGEDLDGEIDDSYKVIYYSITGMGYKYMRNYGHISYRPPFLWGATSYFNIATQILSNYATSLLIREDDFRKFGSRYMHFKDRKVTAGVLDEDEFILNASLLYSHQAYDTPEKNRVLNTSVYVTAYLPRVYTERIFDNDDSFEEYRASVPMHVREYLALKRFNRTWEVPLGEEDENGEVKKKKYAVKQNSRVVIVCPDYTACMEAAGLITRYDKLQTFFKDKGNMYYVYFISEGLLKEAEKNGESIQKYLMQLAPNPYKPGKFQLVAAYRSIFDEDM